MVAVCPFEEKANLDPCHYEAVVFVVAFIPHFTNKCFKLICMGEHNISFLCYISSQSLPLVLLVVAFGIKRKNENDRKNGKRSRTVYCRYNLSS